MKRKHLFSPTPKVLIGLGILFFSLITVFNCSQDNKDKTNPIVPYSTNTNTVTDIDGNKYRIVKIGNQWWMAENLKVTNYRNGDAIPNVTNNNEWRSLTKGAYCNYNNDTNKVAVYGRLYNWYAVIDSRNIAPVGWHVPNAVDWQTLVNQLGGNSQACGKMKDTDTTHWQTPNTGATNTSGFSALPGGRRAVDGGFDMMGTDANFWSTAEKDSFSAFHQNLRYGNSSVFWDWCFYKQDGYSVRLVRD
jgi:uncharacterized protein (TIGR02145 family)